MFALAGIFSKIKIALAAIGAIIALLAVTAFTFFIKGKKIANADHTIKELDADKVVNRRMNNADTGPNATDDDNSKWLRERGKPKRRP